MAQTPHAELEYIVPQHHFLGLCEAYSLECIEPQREYIENQSREGLFFADAGHLSPAGTRLMAQILD